MTKYILLFIIGIFFAFTSCSGLFDNKVTGTIIGIITDTSSVPITNAKVYTSDQTVLSVYSDNFGKFIIEEIPIDTITLYYTTDGLTIDSITQIELSEEKPARKYRLVL